MSKNSCLKIHPKASEAVSDLHFLLASLRLLLLNVIFFMRLTLSVVRGERRDAAKGKKRFSRHSNIYRRPNEVPCDGRQAAFRTLLSRRRSDSLGPI